MSNEKINEQSKIMVEWTEDGGVHIIGNNDDIKKVALILGESFLNGGNPKEEDINKIIDIGIILFGCDNLSAEEKEAAKKFLAVGESRKDPEATDCLSCLQENPLVADAMWLRAADRGSGSAIDNLHENYKEQAAYWRKKIAEAEGKSFTEETPTDDEFFNSPRLKFFEVYKLALDGDLDAMRTCLEFCAEEANYWARK